MQQKSYIEGNTQPKKCCIIKKLKPMLEKYKPTFLQRKYVLQVLLLTIYILQKRKVLVVQCQLLSPTLCDPMDCRIPGFPVHGLLQARILDGQTFPSPRDLFNPGIKTKSPALQVDSLPPEPRGKHQKKKKKKS